MKFMVKDKEGKLYLVADINFYAMGSVNPDVKFLLWDVAEECWLVDYASNYIYVNKRHSVKPLSKEEIYNQTNNQFDRAKQICQVKKD